MSGADLQSAELTFPCTQLTCSALKCGWVRSTAPVSSCHLLSPPVQEERPGSHSSSATTAARPLTSWCLSLIHIFTDYKVQSEALGIQVPVVLDHKHSPFEKDSLQNSVTVLNAQTKL